MNPKDAPICPDCNEKTILADAGVITSIPYWYCRNCKREVGPLDFMFSSAFEIPDHSDFELELEDLFSKRKKD